MTAIWAAQIEWNSWWTRLVGCSSDKSQQTNEFWINDGDEAKARAPLPSPWLLYSHVENEMKRNYASVVSQSNFFLQITENAYSPGTLKKAIIIYFTDDRSMIWHILDYTEKTNAGNSILYAERAVAPTVWEPYSFNI